MKKFDNEIADLEKRIVEMSEVAKQMVTDRRAAGFILRARAGGGEQAASEQHGPQCLDVPHPCSRQRRRGCAGAGTGSLGAWSFNHCCARVRASSVP